MKNPAVNQQYFSAERVKSGAMSAFIQTLLTFAYDTDDKDTATYNDVHVYPADCGAFMVEWAQEPWSREYGGSFQYVDEDQLVVLERSFPDGTYEYFGSEEEFTTALNNWLMEHPEYHQNQWGRWTTSDDASDEDTEDDEDDEHDEESPEEQHIDE